MYKVLDEPTALVELTPSETTTLITRARQGDAEAFNELCLCLKTRLLRQAVIVCGDASLAQDLAQETLVEAWKSIQRYNGSCQFFTWLCAILHNRYCGFLRRKRLLVFFGLNRFDRDSGAEPLEQVADSVLWPDQAAASNEQATLVRQCVQALPSKHQQVVYLRFFVDDSLEGIAAALGCSIGTVKSRLFNALEKLRRMPILGEQVENRRKIGVV